jgi:hypothetical protein
MWAAAGARTSGKKQYGRLLSAGVWGGGELQLSVHSAVPSWQRVLVTSLTCVICVTLYVTCGFAGRPGDARAHMRMHACHWHLRRLHHSYCFPSLVSLFVSPVQLLGSQLTLTPSPYNQTVDGAFSNIHTCACMLLTHQCLHHLQHLSSFICRPLTCVTLYVTRAVTGLPSDAQPFTLQPNRRRRVRHPGSKRLCGRSAVGVKAGHAQLGRVLCLWRFSASPKPQPGTPGGPRRSSSSSSSSAEKRWTSEEHRQPWVRDCSD